jgi:hypothetical protein
LNQLTTKSSLTTAQRQLVELLQQLNFGRLERLRVKNGQPTFEPRPHIIKKLKIGGGDNAPRPESNLADFWLKQQTAEMLQAISDLGDGVVLSIDVRHGLPFSIEIEHFTDKTDRLSHA